MKKTLSAILVLFLMIGACCSACAQTVLIVGEDGLVRDSSGMVYGATKSYDDWLARMHAQGKATNAIAYRPLSVVDGYVYSDVTGERIGVLSETFRTAELGDSSVGISGVCVAAGISFATLMLTRNRRRQFTH